MSMHHKDIFFAGEEASSAKTSQEERVLAEYYLLWEGSHSGRNQSSAVSNGENVPSSFSLLQPSQWPTPESVSHPIIFPSLNMALRTLVCLPLLFNLSYFKS
jgi:hypothetical protein